MASNSASTFVSVPPPPPSSPASTRVTGPSSSPPPPPPPVTRSSVPSVLPSSNNTPPQSSAAPPQSSAAPPPPSSNTPAPPPSSNPPASSPPRSTAPPPGPTQVVTAPSAAPTATEIQTSIILVTASPTRPGESVVVITSVLTAPPGSRPTNGVDTAGSAKSTSTNPTEFQNAKSDTSGLSPGGKTAIAVVIPVIAVALLVLGALFFWRKRKQRKSAEDERRKEVEEYGFNPNHDPTLPTVAMAEDDAGYRGWGNTNTSSKGKASTTLTSGMTYSDSNSNPGGYANPGSPTHGTYSDANSNDPLMNRRETLDSDGIGALGAVGGAAAYSSHNAGVRRGPSNASSSYSAAGQSDGSGEYPGMPNNGQHDYYNNDSQGYYQANPYGNHDPYANNQATGQQPVIRDVSARRNTRIENPRVGLQQGNAGISQNF